MITTGRFRLARMLAREEGPKLRSPQSILTVVWHPLAGPPAYRDLGVDSCHTRRIDTERRVP